MAWPWFTLVIRRYDSKVLRHRRLYSRPECQCTVRDWRAINGQGVERNVQSQLFTSIWAVLSSDVRWSGAAI
jgi:hypothetical protein